MPLLLRNATLTLAKMALTGLAYFVVLRDTVAEAPSYLTITAIAHGAGLVAYLPISFNGLGTVEVSAIGLFAILGVSADGVLAAYLILRVLTLILAWVPALLCPPASRHDRTHVRQDAQSSRSD